MINRESEKTIKELAGQFKALAIVGPRQSGKTTIVKYVFPEKKYVSLEIPDTRQFAKDDPKGFLAQFPDGAILDEIQRVPELFSYLQVILDNEPATGKFILTGSNNFLLQESISQSLAGRVAYLFLLPFSLSELPENDKTDVSVVIFKGLYPPLYDQPVDANRWYPNYIRTYIERDVRLIKNISDIDRFERFIKLCAGRTGQLLNMNSMAIDTGVDNKTISSWLSVLENSFVLFRLQPHHKNFNKRIVKMHKLFFYDTGLASSLLGFQNKEQLRLSPYYGAMFENLVVSDLMKYRLNRAENPNLYFWRDNTGNEIDIILEKPEGLYPVEIKSGKTITNEFFKGLNRWAKISGQEKGSVIYAGDEIQHRSNGISVLPWNQYQSLF